MNQSDAIPKTSFTVEEAEGLERLLEKVAQDDYRWPTEKTMRAAHKVVPYPATELVIIRWIGDKLHILLAVYDGGVEEYRGLWHIPGGYFNNNFANVQEVCSSISLRECKISVLYVRVLDIHWWWPEEHPCGRPLSVFVECLANGEITETESLRFFPVDDLPEMVPVHKRFIRGHFCKIQK